MGDLTPWSVACTGVLLAAIFLFLVHRAYASYRVSKREDKGK